MIGIITRRNCATGAVVPVAQARRRGLLHVGALGALAFLFLLLATSRCFRALRENVIYSMITVGVLDVAAVRSRV